MELQENINDHRQQEIRPQFFYLDSTDDRQQLQELFTAGKILQVNDTYREQVAELLEIRNPSLDEKERNNLVTAYMESDSPPWQQGVWVYYPWRGLLVHLLPEAEFIECRTNRNHHFITQDEQKAFYHSKIGIAGLSVGNSVALSLVLSGGARDIVLADFDTLSITNLNRVRTGVHSLGEKKTTICAREIYELNPYMDVTVFDQGINQDTVHAFTDGLDIIIDELDNIGIKLLLREIAREKKIPLIMATDNGDDGIIDIERHDLQKTAFFHGAIGDVSYKDLLHLSKPEIGKYASKIIGMENVHSKMLGSLDELGKTLVSWPQLGNAATLNGTAVAYACRKILTGEPLQSGRSYLSLDQTLMPQDAYQAEKQKRKELIRSMTE